MFSNTRRRIGVLAAVAVLAALVPTLATSPVSAAPATTAITTVTEAAAAYKACPTSANIPSAGFTDTTDTAVDCLKYYGITSGTTATTYSPTDTVTRWQMALYMTRLIDVANVALGTGADQGFTDISGKSAEIQTAINQIKQAGITTGKTATTYAPDDNVSRQEMALFVERMLDNLPAGPGGVSEAELVTGLATTYINSNCGTAAACTGVYNYSDIDSGSVTVEASNSIKELFTLGIHDGIAATTFNPLSDMTRAAMATFLNAALDHTNVRPEGLHLQASIYAGSTNTVSPTLSVSYRDASFDPIASAPVDVMYWTNSTTEGNVAFLATGLCDNAVGTTDSITGCKIDTSETATDENGNMIPTANATDQLATIYPGADTYYAWTAAAGTIYDNDLHGEAAEADKHSSITVTANPAAASVRCSVDTPAYAKTATAAHTVAFGTTHTVTCQTVSATSGATAGATATPLQLMKMTRSQVFTTDNLTVQQGDTLISESTQAYTDATGAVTFTIVGPTDTAGTDVITDSFVITAVAPLTVEYAAATAANYSGHMADDATDLQFSLIYKDATAAIANGTVTVTQTDNAGLPSALGVTRSATATARDQYGNVLPAQTVTFTDAQTQIFSGAACTAATPMVCTTLAAHGLSVGEDIAITALGSDITSCSKAAATGMAAGDLGAGYRIDTTPLGTTFTVELTATSFVLGCGVAPVAATPMSYTTTSFDNAANNTRVTNTAGQATFSWVDTEPNGGKDTVTAATGGVSGTSAYYKTTTAASFLEDGNLDGTLADDEDSARILSFDAAANTMLAEITHLGGAGNTNAALTQFGRYYYEYVWDANDQFNINATNGTAGTGKTEAAWETDVAANLTLGASAIDFINMISYEALSTGTSKWHTN